MELHERTRFCLVLLGTLLSFFSVNYECVSMRFTLLRPFHFCNLLKMYDFVIQHSVLLHRFENYYNNCLQMIFKVYLSTNKVNILLMNICKLFTLVNYSYELLVIVSQ